MFRSLAWVLAVLFLILSFGKEAQAMEPWVSDCYVLSEGACLMDGDSGVILYSRNSDSAYYPASITKVLTALVTIENCGNLSEMVTFSYDAVHIEEENSTIIGASEGDKLSVLDCLYCLLFQSANEVANALGEHVGAKHPELKEQGMTDLDVFVLLMNRKAEELGCTGSHFNNPSGLTDKQHYTTPHDMCLILSAAIKNEVFCDVESHTYWKHAPIRRYPDAEDPWNTVYMKHLMLRKNSSNYYPGCIAGKTGYTVTAGNTLVTACRRDGMTLVCCVMNAHANHYNDTIRLFNFGYDHFTSLNVAEYDLTDSLVQSDFRIDRIPVLDSLTVGIPRETRITIPKGGDFSEVTSRIEKTETENGPLCSILYSYGDHLAGSAVLEFGTLGGMREVQEAMEDPVFYQLAGIEPPAKTESQTDSAAEEGSAVSAESAEAGESAADGSAVPAGEADTSETPAAEEKNDSHENSRGSVLKTAGLIAAGMLLLLLLFLFLRYRKEKAEEERRRKRRLEHMRKTEDLTGSQRIRMDLEVNRRSGRKKGNRK